MTDTTVRALDIMFESSDIGTITVRGYLQALLIALFDEGEGFSGKRPFGNSGWEYDIARPFIAEGIIKGALDEDGYVETMDDAEFQTAIREAIAAL